VVVIAVFVVVALGLNHIRKTSVNLKSGDTDTPRGERRSGPGVNKVPESQNITPGHHPCTGREETCHSQGTETLETATHSAEKVNSTIRGTLNG
jgi:hypothetical protein